MVRRSKKSGSRSLKNVPETVRKECDSFLEDFDRQVNAEVEAMDTQLRIECEKIQNLYKMALFSLPRNVRKETFETAFEAHQKPVCGKSRSSVASSVEASVKATVTELVQQKVSRIKPRVSKKIPASTKKDSAVATSTVRKSSRNKYLKEPQTPIALSTAMKMKPLKTPLITPKFDVAKPLPRSVMRVAKPNETLVSLSGSPVYASSFDRKQASSQFASVPLGQGQMLMVPTDQQGQDSVPDSLPLDDEACQRLRALQQRIDAMLKLRNDRK